LIVCRSFSFCLLDSFFLLVVVPSSFLPSFLLLSLTCLD
jgi:hypothetical protein